MELLEASWAYLDAVAAASAAELRKGPRGGGRDRDAMLRHVQEAERAYAPKVGCRVPPRTPWEQQRAMADAYNVAALAYEGGWLCWRWDGAELSTIRHRIATSTVDLLASQSAERIGRCPGPGCGWFFLDTTKRGNRRWSSMSDCGQESKSARRRSRRETPTAG